MSIESQHSLKTVEPRPRNPHLLLVWKGLASAAGQSCPKPSGFLHRRTSSEPVRARCFTNGLQAAIILPAARTHIHLDVRVLPNGSLVRDRGSQLKLSADGEIPGGVPIFLKHGGGIFPTKGAPNEGIGLSHCSGAESLRPRDLDRSRGSSKSDGGGCRGGQRGSSRNRFSSLYPPWSQRRRGDCRITSLHSHLARNRIRRRRYLYVRLSYRPDGGPAVFESAVSVQTDDDNHHFSRPTQRTRIVWSSCDQ